MGLNLFEVFWFEHFFFVVNLRKCLLFTFVLKNNFGLSKNVGRIKLSKKRILGDIIRRLIWRNHFELL